jgi:hypothetical protein
MDYKDGNVLFEVSMDKDNWRWKHGNKRMEKDRSERIVRRILVLGVLQGVIFVDEECGILKNEYG